MQGYADQTCMVPAACTCLQDFLRTGCDLEVSLKDLRLLLPTLSLDAAAIAGQAVALSQWHQVSGSWMLGHDLSVCHVGPNDCLRSCPHHGAAPVLQQFQLRNTLLILPLQCDWRDTYKVGHQRR